jgi:hypothetical protein
MSAVPCENYFVSIQFNVEILNGLIAVHGSWRDRFIIDEIHDGNERTTNEQRMSGESAAGIIVVKSRARCSYECCFVEQSRWLGPQSVPFVVAVSSVIVFSVHSSHRPG